ncbi:MAG: class I SAM-dependent methyltransferase [Ardenticatenaceae bacterium]|nr:class I SAM-dependent methyltransferase [Ardenticatenaceae bacterium]
MPPQDSWSSADAYDRYMGRWSRIMAREFLTWLNLPPGLDWVDVGCGTGALTAAILELAAPNSVRAFDLSPSYVDAARERVADPRSQFAQGDATALPQPDAAFHVAVSGLMLNFVPDPERVLQEMQRVVTPDGTIAVYLWDYAEGMECIRAFWDTAVSLDPSAAERDEGARFSLCRPDPLRRLFENVGLKSVEVRSLEIPTRFQNFDDYWAPFEGGQGPAPGYVVALNHEERARLRTALASRLPPAADGTLPLIARAWGVRGTT